jgi:hypothetical protein
VKGIGIKSTATIEVLSAYSAPQLQIDSVAATPGWTVVGDFYMELTETIRLELIGCVSGPGLTMRTRLFDMVALTPVAGTEASITETTDVRRLSPMFELPGGRLYQIQVEVTGDAGDSFGVVRAASPTV